MILIKSDNNNTYIVYTYIFDFLRTLIYTIVDFYPIYILCTSFQNGNCSFGRPTA